MVCGTYVDNPSGKKRVEIAITDRFVVEFTLPVDNLASILLYCSCVVRGEIFLQL